MEELNKLKTREKYINNQFLAGSEEYKVVKQKLEELEKKGASISEVVSKLTNELTEISERADDLKENFESKDSGIHDTSPLVRIKAALQQIKQEIYSFDLRLGVVSNTLLSARVHSLVRRRHGKKHHGGKKNWKQRHDNPDNSGLSGEDD